MSGMEIVDGITVITLPAQVDSVTAPGIEQQIAQMLKPGARVLVDGGEVTYMSAAGIRALAAIQRTAEQQRIPVILCRFEGAAADCLDVSGFTQLLEVAASRAEAMAALRPKLAGNPAESLHRRDATG
ncbi:MAG: STAS domain-containing protein [Alphaproteobacteria bacterium]|nr:STAS domain-containing protein [Alphaproteobacteria bacterium]